MLWPQLLRSISNCFLWFSWKTCLRNACRDHPSDLTLIFSRQPCGYFSVYISSGDTVHTALIHLASLPPSPLTSSLVDVSHHITVFTCTSSRNYELFDCTTVVYFIIVDLIKSVYRCRLYTELGAASSNHNFPWNNWIMWGQESAPGRDMAGAENVLQKNDISFIVNIRTVQ